MLTNINFAALATLCAAFQAVSSRAAIIFSLFMLVISTAIQQTDDGKLKKEKKVYFGIAKLQAKIPPTVAAKNMP